MGAWHTEARKRGNVMDMGGGRKAGREGPERSSREASERMEKKASSLSSSARCSNDICATKEPEEEWEQGGEQRRRKAQGKAGERGESEREGGEGGAELS